MNAKLSCPVLTSMPKLRVATLSVCSHLLDAAVTALCDGAPLLEELTLWRCASLRAPRIKGAELRLVNLCENALIDDEGAGRIGGAWPVASARCRVRREDSTQLLGKARFRVASSPPRARGRRRAPSSRRHALRPTG